MGDVYSSNDSTMGYGSREIGKSPRILNEPQQLCQQSMWSNLLDV